MTPRASLSVVVTNYNYRNFVVEAVESALAQTRPADRIIVVDDGSTDGSSDLLRQRYGEDARVRLLFDQNDGQLAAFQRGVAAAEGDVVCFLDADDRWAPNYLEKIGALFDARPDVDFVFSDIVLFGGEQGRIEFAEQSVDLGFTIVSTYMTAHWYGAPTSALSLRTHWARRTLALPEEMRPTWRISADNCLVFGASILGAHKYYEPTGSVHYRVHGANGWWGKQTPANKFLNRVRSLGLIQHYARSIGLDERCVDLTKAEFLSKPYPTWEEAKRYARLVMKRRASWLKNAGRAAAILGRAWRSQPRSSG